MGRSKSGENAQNRTLTNYRTGVSAFLHLAKFNHHIYRFIYQPYPKPVKPEHYAKAQQFFTTALVAARVYVYKDPQTHEPMIVPPDWIQISGDVIEYSKIRRDRMPDIKTLVCYGDKMFNDRCWHFPLAPAVRLYRKFTHSPENMDSCRKKRWFDAQSARNPDARVQELEEFEQEFLDALKIDVTPFTNLTEAFLKEYYPKDYGNTPTDLP